MITNEYAQNLYKWDRIGILDDTFHTNMVSWNALKDAVYKPKKQRKKMRRFFFAFGYDIQQAEVMTWLRYDLDIKRHKLHDKISAKIGVSQLTTKQRKKYRKELSRSIIYMKMLRSQLKLKLLPDYFIPSYELHNEQIDRLIIAKHGTT